VTPEEEVAGVGEDKAIGPPPTGVDVSIYMEFFMKLFSGRKKWADHSTAYGRSGVSLGSLLKNLLNIT
jgi:hypothetical protein